MDTLALAVVTCLAAGLAVGVLLPWRWALAVAVIGAIAYTGFFIAQNPSRHPFPMEAFVFVVIVFPSTIFPAWLGTGAGIAIRLLTRDRLLARFLATAAAAALIGGLHYSLQADPAWKKAAEKDGEAFVREHGEVLARVGTIESANPISMRLGDSLPYSQIEYYVRGAKDTVVVVVHVSGERKAPTFRVASITRGK